MPHALPVTGAARRARPALQKHHGYQVVMTLIGAVQCPSRDMPVMALMSLVFADHRIILWLVP